MEVRIIKRPGLRNDVVAIIPSTEIQDTLFHIANRSEFMKLPGLLRPKPLQTKAVKDALANLKLPVVSHLKLLSTQGPWKLVTDQQDELTEDEKKNGTTLVQHPMVVIGSRNVGNNHGFVAWQRGEIPPLFQILREPWSYPSYSCLAKNGSGRLEIKEFFHGNPGVPGESRELPRAVEWCVFGQQVLKNGNPVPIREIISRFQDIRHVLVVAEGSVVEQEIYDGYPNGFGEKAWEVHSKKGVPRSRYLFNCLGLSKGCDRVIIIQREGTTDEAAQWLLDEGAENGLILDNGASPFLWAWWVDPVEVKRGGGKVTQFRGGYLYTAPDFRPKASAVLVFVLKGPAFLDLESGTQQSTII